MQFKGTSLQPRRCGGLCNRAVLRCSGAVMLALTVAGGVQAQSSRPAAGDERMRGIIKAVHQAALSTELQARVEVIGVREGERFKKGDMLIKFDCSRQLHELAALAATEREMRVSVESNRHLSKLGAANRNDLETAQARYDKAKAEAASMQARLTQCQFLAPFSGSVIELSINPYEFPSSNRPFMVVAGDEPLEVEIIASSRAVPLLKNGASLRFAVDERARSYDLKILRTAGAIDGVSQTFKIYAGFAAESIDVLPGMSGTARIMSETEVGTDASVEISR
jgi:membrane fusion protein, multidrug efflux system